MRFRHSAAVARINLDQLPLLVVDHTYLYERDAFTQIALLLLNLDTQSSSIKFLLRKFEVVCRAMVEFGYLRHAWST